MELSALKFLCFLYMLFRKLKPRLDWQISCARKLAGVNGVSGAIFLVQENLRQKLASLNAAIQYRNNIIFLHCMVKTSEVTNYESVGKRQVKRGFDF